ncbi:unnamed protein product [Urochloa decumbens]|uniref:DUF4057 domain-containing protein n=1 Tax=Urochloa decumbens TaxID=240449 RepID=A0ABC8WTX1_9POAL
MERAAPVRSSHTSTADLLAWPQPQGAHAPATPSPPRRPGQVTPPVTPPPSTRVAASSPVICRSRLTRELIALTCAQPSEAIRKVVFGGQVTEEEADSLTKRKPCSAPKWKEMTGSGIFAAGSNGDSGEAADAAKPARTASRQAISTVSNISFAEDGTDPPKKPTSVAEVAKQRELSGTLQSEADSKMKKQISNAKSKELSGHDIFSDTQESRLNRARNSSNGSSASHTPVKNANASTFSFGEANIDSTPKTAKKITGKKVNDLSGNDIFKGDVPPASAEKHLSTAKLKEITGSNIFADGKEPTRERVGGNRKPPGGESSIALI